MDLPSTPLQRVSVVGSTGTGKTTFGRELAAMLGVPFVELDALAWEPNWTLADAKTLQARVRQAIASDAWVVDGNYGGRGVRELVWARADTIVWLDYALPVIFVRLWRRTIERVRSGEELWPGTGNRESFRNTFFSRESLFIWALKTYGRRRRTYTQLFRLSEHAQRARLRFTHPADAERWLVAERARHAGTPD